MKLVKKIMANLMAVLLLLNIATVTAYAEEPTPAPAYITYVSTDFADAGGSTLNLAGNASIDNGLYLTKHGMNEVGSAFFGSKIKSTEGFSTYFKFSLTNRGFQPGSYMDRFGGEEQKGADGLVFIISSATNQYGSSGSGLGYEGINNSVGIEFDSFENSGDLDWEKSHSHIAVNYNGNNIVDTTPLAYKLLTESYFNADGPFYAWIDYDADSHTLDIRLNNINSRPADATLSTTIDLSQYAGEEYFVGFTSATGQSVEDHVINKWLFSNTYIANGLDSAEEYAMDSTAPSKPLVTLEETNVTFTGALDTESGVFGYEYSVDDGEWITGTSLALNTLSGGNHTISARAVDNVGNISDVEKLSLTVPDAPTNVTAETGNGQAIVTFTAPSDSGSSEITGYTIHVYSNGELQSGLSAFGSSSPITVTGLTNGTAYTFKIIATNAVGDSTESAASSPVTPVTVPGAPTNVTAVAGDGQATVTFSTPSDNGGSVITGYEIISNPGGIIASGIAAPITITGLTNGTAFRFTVRAINAAGSSSASSPSPEVIPEALGENEPDTFMVTFNSGDSGYVTISTVSGSAISITDIPANPTRSGFTFEGWFKEAECINVWNFDTDIITGNITLHAKWTENPVTPEAAAAPAVTVNDTSNTLMGANNTMEYSTNGGGSWATYNSANPPIFSGNQTVMVRVAATGSTPVGNITTVQFTQNSSDHGGSVPTPNGSGNQTAGSDIESIMVDVKQGDTDNTAARIKIERKTGAEGKKNDSVTYQEDKATETVTRLKQEGKDTARIVIPDTKGEVTQTTITIPSKSLFTLSDGEINLQIDTAEVKVDITKQTLKGISQTSDDDLYFRVIPVKDEIQKKTAVENAILAAMAVNDNAGNTVSLIGNPVTIETNMSSTAADITVPLNGITIPTDPAERALFLLQLAVYIVHSDNDKELVQGELVEYRDGVYGIKVHINKFSTFTVVKTDAFVKSSEKSIIKVMLPTGATVKGKTITAKVGSEVTYLKVDLQVSEKAIWKLYQDKNCKIEIKDKQITLLNKKNMVYVKVTAEDGGNKIYTMTINKAEPEPIKVKYGFYPLLLIAKRGTDSQNLTYTKVSDADGYLLYGAPCGKDNHLEKIAELKVGTTGYKVTGLKENTYYKYQVSAYKLVNGKKVILAVSKVVHTTTDSKKYTNPSKVTSNVSTVSLNVEESQTLQCDIVLPKSKIIDMHTDKIQYESTNKVIAVVDNNGKITAKEKGSCYIYAFAQNGVYKKIKVVVK